MLASIINGSVWQRRPTWQNELLGVAALLTVLSVAVTFIGESTTLTIANWLSTFAVIFSFASFQVGSRLEEASSQTSEREREQLIYSFWKEGAWIVVFALTGLVTALVGRIIFLLYPSWRVLYLASRNTKPWYARELEAYHIQPESEALNFEDEDSDKTVPIHLARARKAVHAKQEAEERARRLAKHGPKSLTATSSVPNGHGQHENNGTAKPKPKPGNVPDPSDPDDEA